MNYIGFLLIELKLKKLKMVQLKFYGLMKGTSNCEMGTNGIKTSAWKINGLSCLLLNFMWQLNGAFNLMQHIFHFGHAKKLDQCVYFNNFIF